MDIDKLLERQAIIAWRDALVLSILQIVNRAGIAAKHGVETDLSEAGLVDSLWDPASFTRARVDSVMQAATLPKLEVLFTSAAADLQAINSNYGGLADALLESLNSLHLPEVEGTVDLPAEETPPAPQLTGRVASAIAVVSRQQLIKSARALGSRALDMVGEASDAASQKLQSGTGLHDRLRRSAQARIEEAWMASAGDPPTLIAQLFSVVETVGSEARRLAR